jgi:hypothetical protein
VTRDPMHQEFSAPLRTTAAQRAEMWRAIDAPNAYRKKAEGICRVGRRDGGAIDEPGEVSSVMATPHPSSFNPYEPLYCQPLSHAPNDGELAQGKAQLVLHIPGNGQIPRREPRRLVAHVFRTSPDKPIYIRRRIVVSRLRFPEVAHS